MGAELRRSAGIRGVIGTDLAAHHTVELDYDARRLRLHDAESYKYEGAGTVLPVRRPAGGWISVEAELRFAGRDPVRGNFLVDTAAVGAAAVILNTPFVQQHKLDSLPGPSIESRATAVGGPLALRVVRAEGLRLGELDIPRPTVGLSRSRDGLTGDKHLAGIIGGDVLSRCRVVFDLSRQRLILEKGRDFAAPFECDMSGLTLAVGSIKVSALHVFAVAPDSPAAEAGLLVHDRILTVDGKPAGEIVMDELLDRLSRPDQTLKLRVRRGEREFDVELRTRRMV